MKSPEKPKEEDWKKRLKALGIARRKRPKRDLLRKEEGDKRPGGAAGSQSGEARTVIHPFEEVSLRTPQGVDAGSHGREARSAPLPLEEISLRTLQKVTSGRLGEDAACALLAGNSLEILDRNVRYPDGEIDIVALDGATTVFVEVKRRKNAALGTPAEAVTRTKRARVVRAARRWLMENPGRAREREVRFDVVAIQDDPLSIEWLRGAFDASRA